LIPLSIPLIAGREWDYVKQCLDTGWVSSAGPFVERFESAFADCVGSSHAIACASGTAALTLALRVAGVERDDEVLLPTITFIAPVNAASYLGAHPVFFDCDEFYNLDVQAVGRFLEQETQVRAGAVFNRRSGRRIRAAVMVHVFGNAGRMGELIALCRERGISVIEDACEALGTRYTVGEAAGHHAGTLGDIGCFSFNGNKIITTGGGGMVVTANSEYARRVRYLSTQAKDDEVRYIHHEIGYNDRLTNVQAALGVAQLEQLSNYLERKRLNFNLYRHAVAQISGLNLALPPPYAVNNLWMYALQIDSAVYGEGRESLMQRLSERGIQTRPLWYPNHLQRPFRGAQAYGIERALKLLECTLNIPCSVGLVREDLEKVVEALRR
jgi:perosamine synthetase